MEVFLLHEHTVETLQLPEEHTGLSACTVLPQFMSRFYRGGLGPKSYANTHNTIKYIVLNT